MNNVRFLLGLFLSLTLTQGTAWADLLPFQWRGPLPQGNNLNGVIYANGIFVAVGDYGTVVTSEDGTNWQVQNTGLAAPLATVCAGNGLFVAAGANGTIITSPDGTNWTPRTSGDTNNFLSSAYGNSIFVLGDSGGKVAISPDAVVWTSATTILSPVASLAFRNGHFLAFDGNEDLARSTDGYTWSTVTDTIPGPLQTTAITFGNGNFYRMGYDYRLNPGSRYTPFFRLQRRYNDLVV